MTTPSSSTRRRSVLGAVLMSLVLLASQAASAVAQDATPAATPATAASNGTLETVPCDRYVLPEPLVDGENVECAYLTVPAFHGEPGSPRIRVHTIRLFATGSDPVDQPLIYLAGGPGQAGSSQLPAFVSAEEPAVLAPVLERQDVILLDQRGTGASEPSLACPGDVTPGLLPPGGEQGMATPASTPAATPIGGAQTGTPDPEQGVDPAVACLSDFEAAGIDLTAFNTEQNAQDVAALIGALGTGQADIYGVSYGSYLGETVITRFPDLVRSAVLTSIVPPGADLLVGQLEYFNRTLTNVFDGCAADPECNAVNPNLDEALQTTYDQLTAEPITVEVTNLVSGQPEPVIVNGSSYVQLIYQLLLVGGSAVVPSLVSTLADGDVSVLSQVGSLLIPSLGVSNGMLYATGCQDIYPNTTPESLDEALAAGDIRPVIVDGYGGTAGYLLSICDAAGLPESEIADEPVDSAVPTLLVSGEHDPYTPTEFAEQVLPGLENGQAITLPGVAHDPLGAAGECGASILAGFLASPEAPVEASCSASLATDYSAEPSGGTATPAA